ncbi:hypothetical protein LAZ67_X001211 [Cordylochernes scorpioides]|uniref:RNA-directed DNA polymerase n=1 Tax=Cordylochernes scorpioides TaxID=51811 RepID=A0ABY6LSP4_9ARAC|nr:hypothetical protein LAZ67_X001211 [Cordylochernes scorpioides]
MLKQQTGYDQGNSEMWLTIGEMAPSSPFHGAATSEIVRTRQLVGKYCDQGARTDLICSMDKTPPPYIIRKPLIYAFQQNLEKASPRQVRQLQYISQFTTSIRQVSGKDNLVADTLSRISEIISIDYDIIAEKQQDDTELSNLRSQNKLLIFKEHCLPSGKTLWCDISTNRIRPYIPEFRMNVFTSIHGLSHPGIKTTVREVTSRYIWLNINKDIRNWTKGCINCQKSKITRHTKTEYGEFGKPDERFGTVHIDLIGPLPPSEGKTYCLTLIDRSTNWVEVLPLEDLKADTIIKSFYKEWISRYGTPCHLITDRGMQFMSQKLKEFAKMCGIQLKHTTSYHPQSNGKIERFHRTLKTAISSHSYIRTVKYFTVMVKGKEDNVSLDRLKPAYLLKESYPEDDDRRQQPGIQQDLQPSKARTQRVHFEEPQRTRSGRRPSPVNSRQLRITSTITRNKQPFPMQHQSSTANSSQHHPTQGDVGKSGSTTEVRLQWCRERSTWNCTDWGRIFFSDEYHFLLCPDDRRKRVWRRPGQCVDPGLTVEHHTGPQKGVMV